MRFSQRMGLRPVREVIQREDVDEATRNRLWDVAWSCLPDGDSPIRRHPQAEMYYKTWIDFFEEPADQIPTYSTEIHGRLRKQFFGGTWDEMYDVLEHLVQMSGTARHRATEYANDVLKDFLCAYRFVGGDLVEMTDEQEIATVEKSLAHPLTGVRSHLSKSLGLLGDRTSPDASNSIKEAVSAVESLCCSIVGCKTTLGVALKKLEEAGVVLHPSLKAAWGSLYGWTSDEGGVRHAMQDAPGVSAEDAVYMLVSCSAFVSLLTDKAINAGVELQPVS